MDIAGAKALRQRLGPNGSDDVPATPVDVPADAPPVYHWVGVSRLPSDTPLDDSDDASATDSATLFSRLGLNFR